MNHQIINQHAVFALFFCVFWHVQPSICSLRRRRNAVSQYSSCCLKHVLLGTRVQAIFEVFEHHKPRLNRAPVFRLINVR